MLKNDTGTCRRRFLMSGLSVLALPAASAVRAQTLNYPERPVTIIADAAPGSTPDIDARLCAEALTQMWGQQVIVVNHAGAFGSLATRAASEAPADGYTLFMPSLATFIAAPGIAQNLPLKLPHDFLPIGFTAENPMFIAASPALGVSTLPEFIALAKKDPGKITIAANGAGRLTHLTGLVLQDRTGISLVPVPYNGGIASAIADVASGRVSMIIEGYSGIFGAVKAGQVKLLAVASHDRLPIFPDLPIVSETIPDFFASGWQVLVAPVGTPKPIIDKIAADLAKVMDDPAFKEKLAKIGSYSHAMNPEQALAFVDQQQKTWLPVVEKLSAK
ncbi:MAG TPA: tripartite tricarboxylate transporter substrate binding protein [Xanthobacteraceae bacterium]|jgi:tripartite-type tricarboxylate transporter receptor subunit TctC|nr:tripartite tricarboxylate transporter substrate binding protein [Xanthobacteraceae bacterium]